MTLEKAADILALDIQAKKDRALLLQHPRNSKDRVRAGEIPTHWLTEEGRIHGPDLANRAVAALQPTEVLTNATHSVSLEIAESNVPGLNVISMGHADDGKVIWTFKPGRIQGFRKPPHFPMVTFRDLMANKIPSADTRGLELDVGDDYIQCFVNVDNNQTAWVKVSGRIELSCLPVSMPQALRHINSRMNWLFELELEDYVGIPAPEDHPVVRMGRHYADLLRSAVGLWTPRDNHAPATPHFLERVFRQPLANILRKPVFHDRSVKNFVTTKVRNFYRCIDLVASRDARDERRLDHYKLLIELATKAFSSGATEFGTVVVPIYSGADDDRWAFTNKENRGEDDCEILDAVIWDGPAQKDIKIKTAPIRANMEVDLIALTLNHTLIGSGALDHIDQISPLDIQTPSLLFRDRITQELHCWGLPTHHTGWITPVEGNLRERHLTVNLDDLMDGIVDPYVQQTGKLEGVINLELGKLRLNGPASPFAVKIAGKVVELEFVGYTMSVRRGSRDFYQVGYKMDLVLNTAASMSNTMLEAKLVEIKQHLYASQAHAVPTSL